MPSKNKRINLTVPDKLYQRILRYEEENGFTSDATACLQLILKQLNAEDTTKAMLSYINGASIEQLKEISSEGMATLKEVITSKK